MTREEAIQVLKEYRTIVMNCLKAETPAFDMAIEALQTEAVQGEWKHKPSKSGEWVWWQCSECGAVIYSESEADRKIHHAYCGVCGARMKGGAE